MGAGMAACLLRGGHAVRGFDVRLDPVADLAELWRRGVPFER